MLLKKSFHRPRAASDKPRINNLLRWVPNKRKSGFGEFFNISKEVGRVKSVLFWFLLPSCTPMHLRSHALCLADPSPRSSSFLPCPT
jgi:hypothetical protein